MASCYDVICGPTGHFVVKRSDNPYPQPQNPISHDEIGLERRLRARFCGRPFPLGGGPLSGTQFL